MTALSDSGRCLVEWRTAKTDASAPDRLMVALGATSARRSATASRLIMLGVAVDRRR
jgi:hypothetical protein